MCSARQSPSSRRALPFERINVDLANRPDWFKEMSPLGKVPLLKVDGEVLFESAAILEYLEETQPNPLHPSNALTRARHRAWMEFGSTILADIWGFYTASDAAVFDQKTAALRSKFERLEAELGDGPYFAGARFSLVDAVFAPVFRYFDVFDRIAEFGILSGLPKVAGWRSNLASRRSVIAAVSADYPARLEAFIAGKGGHLARHMRLAA
jgi:glutathione S-transferase